MRYLSAPVVLTLILAGSSAAAGVLTDATWTQTVFAPPSISLTIVRTAGQLGSISGSSTATSISVPLELPGLTATAFVAQTPLPPSRQLRVEQGGSQLITATAAMANATQGIPGTAVVMTATHPGTGVNQSMVQVGLFTLLSVPLHVGQAGQFTKTFFVALGVPHTLTVDFSGWTPGTLQFTGLTSKYAPLPNVTAMGSFDLTANGGGFVTLVSPSKLSIDGELLQTRSILTLATLKLSFVPEPGTLLLLAAGAAVLVGAARRRS